MASDKQQKLIQILKENDSKEISFHETKQQLLADGYSEAEITQAIYHSSYDGKKDTVKQADPTLKAYEKDPVLAEKIGNQILEDAKGRERDEAIAMGAASRFAPGRHAQAAYTFEFFERLGLPYFRIFFGGLVLFVFVAVLDLPAWINTIFGAVIIFWILHACYTRFVKK